MTLANSAALQSIFPVLLVVSLQNQRFIHYETQNPALVRPVDFHIQARLSCLLQSTSYSQLGVIDPLFGFPIMWPIELGAGSLMVYSSQQLCHALWNYGLECSLREAILQTTKIVTQTVPVQLARLTLELVQTVLVFFLQGDPGPRTKLLQPFVHVALLSCSCRSLTLFTPALCTRLLTNAVAFSLHFTESWTHTLSEGNCAPFRIDLDL